MSRLQQIGTYLQITRLRNKAIIILHQSTIAKDLPHETI